ncbi:MAG: hypothetical protein AAB393_16100 [Bacteroidota bacterium]|jgi:hypothetical protein
MISNEKMAREVNDDERSGSLVISNVMTNGEEIMGAESTNNADEVVLNMLQRYGTLMMDDLITERPKFSWAQLLLAIDRLSGKNLISLRRVSLSYQIHLTNHECTLDHEQQHEELAASHR